MIRDFFMLPLRFLPDKLYIMLQYYYHFHKLPNLEKPETFNEKLQWLKLYDRKPIYTIMVDKVKAKEFVASKIGWNHIIPTLGVWNSADEIDFDKLPNKFVLKTNHNSKGVLICKNKKDLKIKETVNFLNKQLKTNGYWYGREWPYKDVNKKILAEELLDSKNGDLIDYKFMCFNGKVKCSFVCSDRNNEKELKVTFFDKDWNLLPFERSHPSVKAGFPKPKKYNEMIKYAEILSTGMKFCRIDFYEVNKVVYFGEITLHPGSGLEKFQPDEWDKIIGSWLDLRD